MYNIKTDYSMTAIYIQNLVLLLYENELHFSKMLNIFIKVHPKTTASSSMLFDSDEVWVLDLIRSDSLVEVCVLVEGAACGISLMFDGLGLAPNNVITLSNGMN